MIDRVPWGDWGDLPGFYGPDGSLYLLFQQTLIGDKESIAPDYLSFARQAFKSSPVIYACIANRMQLFSEARFQFRQRRNGRPGDLFGTAELAPLEVPWPGATTADLLALAELYASLAGNFFAARRGDYLKPLRPDWTALVLGSHQDPEVEAYDIDAEVIGYLYQAGGPGSGEEPEVLLPEEVAHYMPIPDPECPHRGMSWLTPVLQELLADKQLTSHKRKFIEGGGTPNLAIKLDVNKLEDFDRWVDKFAEAREGPGGNPYKTLFLAAGADPVPIGTNMQEIDFAKLQGAGEVRMAAAAMVHPAIAGFSEGLQGSALNSGNLKEAFRQFGSSTMRPLWRSLAGSLARVIIEPPGSELWYDDRDIPALAEDESDAADILKTQAESINTLITAGYDPDSVVDAVVSDDLRRLTHTGLTSVQLLPPGQSAGGSSNGSGAPEAVPAP